LQVRFKSTLDRSDDISRARTDTRTILFAGGEFDALPGFRAWVEANNFTLAEDFGDGRALYLKQPSGPVPA